MAGATLFERTKDSTMLNNTFGITNIDVSEEYVRQKETQILEVGKNFKKDGKAKDLADLIRGIRPFLGQISKAKAAKLVKTLIDMFLDLEAGIGIEADLCRECIDWARVENRTFLRQSLEARLILLYIDSRLFTDALHVCNKLLKELKKIDDKNLLVEVLLYESKTYHGLGNLSKSRASLTSARTTANSIYCPPKLQAALDLQSGVLHAADEQDFKTAFSYFYEAFEGYDSVDSNKAVIALKYMLLTKVMLNLPEDVQQLIGGKLGLKYKGRNIEAMKSIAQASHKRSLAGFKESLKEFKVELVDDPIVYEHLDALYDNLLEQNLCRIIEPFSRVEVQFVAEQIKLSAEAVERKLSQMILDKKIPGILDQGEGILIVYEENAPDKTYEIVMDLITSMSKVVDTLYEKAKKLN